MDINEKIRLIAEGEFEVIARLSVDETTQLCQRYAVFVGPLIG